MNKMAVKKIARSSGKPAKKRLVLFHGIQIDPATGKRSAISKIVQKELKQRSETRDEQKSA
ncbi:MAG: hypothetical protein KGJ79_11620 [Alphaproteobacteria bacterium]|nr:hypothetical protein [Alphaproteobacteria bacterium]MDE2495444.1 hypothetical protein [Alphaproteobacteria bacterium]